MRSDTYHGGENFNLRDVLLAGHHVRLDERLSVFSRFVAELNANHESLYMREIESPADREILMLDPVTGAHKLMLMFGSNNYLGLANHPYVRQSVKHAIDRFGVGIGGPPLLNGHTSLHAQLESRIAELKQTEDAMLFSSGYNANVGLLTALLTRRDVMLFDEYSHASFVDGLSISRGHSCMFRHNDTTQLEELLKQHTGCEGDVFVGVEGVYSMDGDCAPLPVIVRLCRTYGARLILDDAHGTGVMGSHGGGTAEFFGVEDSVDVTMGTFSKAFGVVGGFAAGSRELINYLRFFARSHMFSAALPPTVISAVLAGLDLIEYSTELHDLLWENIAYARRKFAEAGILVETDSAIIALRVPGGMNIRKAAYRFNELGIFVNSIEYPAVPVHQQRFRISLMASHTRKDIDRLVDCVAEIWADKPTDANSDSDAPVREASLVT
ncbi:MAG TPA: aminotransferase class I/II-fold pyridoxal phosphate-dependent enzyme [Bacteroidota bacterium]|nr:aminotransferase class I/II-fold pyridoxal phosphate-dependent enzyme [Bacteroidota bacterium]